MLEVRVTIEREGEVVRVFADLTGFYLSDIDTERVLGSIIPLAQHCYWRNFQICVIPERELDHQELLEMGRLVIFFTLTDNLRPPELMINGQWWTSPQGREFFCPIGEDGVDSVIFDRIREDLANEESDVT